MPSDKTETLPDGAMSAEELAATVVTLARLQQSDALSADGRRALCDAAIACAGRIAALTAERDALLAAKERAEGERDDYEELLRDLVDLENERDALSGGGPGIGARWQNAMERAREATFREPIE